MLYNKIKELCARKDIAVSELEKILLFGNGTINKWNTSSPSIDKVRAVANYFGLSVDCLISEDDELPTQEALNTANEYLSLSPTQMGMVKLYISILKNGQTV